MKKPFENKTVWNEYYENAWDARMNIMKEIIASGEKHPLRVINLFESIMRFSEQHRGEDGKFHYNKDSGLLKSENSNIDFSVESMNIKESDPLPSGANESTIRSYKNSFYVSSSYSMTDKIAFLLDYIRNKEFEAIVELGSGYSGNLIKLFYQGGTEIPYYGGEFTDSGTMCADMLGSLTNEFKLIPFKFDYNCPDFSRIKEKNRIFVFTCHSIEQVQKIPDDLIQSIAQIAKYVTCIHLEPFGYQVKIDNREEIQVDQKQAEYFNQNCWNKNLFEVLIHSHFKKYVNLTFIGRNSFPGDDKYNPTSIAVWNNF